MRISEFKNTFQWNLESWVFCKAAHNPRGFILFFTSFDQIFVVNSWNHYASLKRVYRRKSFEFYFKKFFANSSHIVFDQHCLSKRNQAAKTGTKIESHIIIITGVIFKCILGLWVCPTNVPLCLIYCLYYLTFVFLRKVCTSWYDIFNQNNNYRDDATQCAAVTIQSGAIRDPPQMNRPPRRRAI